MRFCSAILALICGICFLSGCSASHSDASGSVNATSEDAVIRLAVPMPNVTVEIPSSYETTFSQNFDEYYIREDASIIIAEDQVTPQRYTLDDYQSYLLDQYDAATDSMELLKIEDYTLEQAPARVIELQYSIELESGTHTVSCLIGFLIAGQSVYLMTCKCQPETYETNRPEFIQVLKSLRY